DHVLESGLVGTSVTWTDVAGIAAAIRADTGLVVMESPANPTLELVNIAAVVSAAGDIPVLVDNTFATPILQRPIEHGAAIVLHSATKYIGGHGDVMGGVIATNEEWATRIRHIRALTGGLLHPLAAYLLHRGLRTLPLRVRAQQATAEELASRLVGHPALTRVIEALRLVTNAVSLGGVDSLAQHPASLTHRPVAPEARPGGGIVRLSIGLEHVEDLAEDILAALIAARP